MTTMPAPTTFAVGHAPVTARTRSGTAWDMVVWAIRDQRTIGEAAGWDDEPCAWSTDGVADMLRYAEIGCWVDGGQHKGLGRERHADVGPVIGALWALEEADRLLVIEHARIGCPPDRPVVQPAPFPEPPRPEDFEEANRVGYADYAGGRIAYRKCVAERVAERVQVRSRGRYGRVTTELRTGIEVLYCPVSYWPSVAMWDHGHAIADRFEVAMEAVAEQLRRARLTSWEVVAVI